MNTKKKIKICKKKIKEGKLKYLKKCKKILIKYKEIKKYKKNIKELKKILKNEKNLEVEMVQMINEEIEKNKINKKKKIKKIKKIIIKKKKREIIIMEITTGVGGEESSIFISDLKKMYEKYIEKMNWKKKIILENCTEKGGYKELIIKIKGKNIYKNLKFESGVHRVQRLPKTENKQRIHTSTCRVAVYKREKKKNIEIKNNDLKIETYKSSGAGGQHVNKTNSAVRIKHLPTNIVVECQKERSQHKNKKHALDVLKTKILLKINRENSKNISKIKKKLFGGGGRVEKIRTYNYKENRFIDHRFKIKLKNLDKIIEGNEFSKIIKIIKKKIKK